MKESGKKFKMFGGETYSVIYSSRLPPMLRHLAFNPGSFFNVYPSPFGSIELFAFGTAGCDIRGCGGFCVKYDFLKEMYVKTSHK